MAQELGGGGTRPRQERCYRRLARGAETTRFVGVRGRGQRQSPQARARRGSYRGLKHLRRHPILDRKARATGSRRAQQRARNGRGWLDIPERHQEAARRGSSGNVSSTAPCRLKKGSKGSKPTR